MHLQLKTPGSLRLFHLKPRDTGSYTCVAENSEGRTRTVQKLAVDNIDLHIWPLGVSSTFVTVVWNGTARNSFPEYQILYRAESHNANERGEHDSSELHSSSANSQRTAHDSRYESVTVSHFLRSYTINHLEPRTKYRLCIGVRDDDANNLAPAAFLQLSCTSVQTQGREYALQGIHQNSTMTVAFSLLASVVMFIAFGMAVLAGRKYWLRTQYQEPEKSLLENGNACAQAFGPAIQMEDIYSPLMPN